MNYLLVVNSDDCGNESEQYRKWLKHNLPLNVKIEWNEGISGVGDGLFVLTENGREEINKNDPRFIDFWEKYCNA
jgi:hypothetical protein